MVTRCLPLDVLLDILSRLPVKSLKRFQCVCKSWHHHLRTPGFVTQHLNFHTKNNKNNCFLVSHIPDPPSRGEPLRNYLTLLHFNETTDDILSLHWLNLSSYFKPEDCSYVDIRGPCNGIYCIIQNITEKGTACVSNKYRIALVNLASREFKALPDHPIISPRPRYILQQIEFCFDPKTNDYKVVFFTTSYHREEERLGFIQALVYSLSCNSWKKVNDTLPDHSLIGWGHSGNNTYVDGNVHLLAYNSIHDHDGVCSYFILSFNVVDEVFQRIKLPGLLGSNLFEMDCNIRAYNGSLSIMVYPISLSWPGRDYKFVDIWVMQAYGNDESWTKQTIGPIAEHVYIASWRNDQFLLRIVCKNDLILLYDSSTQKIKKLFDSPYFMSFQNICIYSESLVSLIGDERNEKNMLFDIVEDHPLFTNRNPDEIEDGMPHAGVWEPYLEEVKAKTNPDIQPCYLYMCECGLCT